jgi:uncharacterized protein (DUF2252 family)
MRDAVAEFMDYNRPFARRNAELLRFKVARMAESPFAFFRGTFHLFARDILNKTQEPLPLLTGDGAQMDIIGDIHSENFGTYKAADGLVHYDVNDFDEATSGRFDLDVCRLAVSNILASQERKDPLGDAVATTLAGVDCYSETVCRLIRKAREHDLDYNENNLTTCPAVDQIIQIGAAAKRSAFIEKMTEKPSGKRRLRRSPRIFNLPDDQREQALRLLADYKMRHPPVDDNKKDYYKVEDVCGRVSGVGSMSRLRYVLLLDGKGDADGRNVLIEFKESRPSSFDVYRGRETSAEALKGRAERVATVERMGQAACNSHLGYAIDGEMSFQAREIAPHDGRVDAKSLKKAADLVCVARVQGAVLARIHARAAARSVGAANPLAELADPAVFAQRVLAFALGYADLVRRDWTRFVGARADLDNVAGWVEK